MVAKESPPGFHKLDASSVGVTEGFVGVGGGGY